MKKIAVATEGNYVSGHFGHCDGFKLYQVEEENIINVDFISNPGHRPGFLPVFLKELETNIIIAGGMGEAAQQLFNENGIDVIVGAKGLCEDAVKEYIKGNLHTTGSVCKEHQHEGDCNH